MSNKFRPSNATQGEAFFAAWCHSCARDKAMREGADLDECNDNERCEIIGLTQIHNVHDPEYPVEWHYDTNGLPTCSAYVAAGDTVTQTRCPNTLELF